MLMIDTIMMLPETSIEREVQRRIAVINAVIAYYGVKEGRSYYDRRPNHPSRHGASMIINTKGQSRPAIALSPV